MYTSFVFIKLFCNLNINYFFILIFLRRQFLLNYNIILRVNKEIVSQRERERKRRERERERETRTNQKGQEIRDKGKG
jgi:hypothetical protein